MSEIVGNTRDKVSQINRTNYDYDTEIMEFIVVITFHGILSGLQMALLNFKFWWRTRYEYMHIYIYIYILFFGISNYTRAKLDER